MDKFTPKTPKIDVYFKNIETLLWFILLNKICGEYLEGEGNVHSFVGVLQVEIPWIPNIPNPRAQDQMTPG